MDKDRSYFDDVAEVKAALKSAIRSSKQDLSYYLEKLYEGGKGKEDFFSLWEREEAVKRALVRLYTTLAERLRWEGFDK